MSSLDDLYEKALQATKEGRARQTHGGHIRQTLGDRVFSGVAWTIERVTRPNGTGYFQLTELAGKGRVDYPVLSRAYQFTYDRPENLPLVVKSWAESKILKWTREAYALVSEE
jgi:hypothetical protein